MKECFGYVRVSTAKQGEGVSLEAQREAIQTFADRQGFSIVRWYEEKETAAKRGRPVFSALVKELRRGKAQGLIIHKIDRSARNFADWAKIGDLADQGIDIHFATESLDFRSRGGRLTADIQAVIAADYIRNLREETIKGITGRLRQGLYPFKAPIGYLDNGGGKPKTPDPVRAPLIRAAFDLYASRQHSLRSLLKELERRGLRNGKDRPISKCCLETVLNNPFYAGLIRIKRTGAVYEGIHESLIPVSLYEEVQAIKEGRCGKKVTRHNHTYRGLFHCGDCQAAMTPELQKGHVYYRCQTRECPTKTIREEALEDAIAGTLAHVRLSDADVEQLTADIEAWCAERQQNTRALTISDQLCKVHQKIESLTDALIERLIDKETFNERKERLVLERARLEQEKIDAARNASDPSRIRKFLELIKSLRDMYFLAKPAEKREIIECATSNRRVCGKSVCLEPANWLVQAESAVTGLVGAPARTTSRTKMAQRHIIVLNNLAKSDITEFIGRPSRERHQPGPALRPAVSLDGRFR